MKTIKIIFYLLIVLLTVSCNNKVNKNTKEAIKWIEKSEKPIIVVRDTIHKLNYNKVYTLIDADAKVYYCGEVNLILPDTIKTINDSIKKDD